MKSDWNRERYFPKAIQCMKKHEILVRNKKVCLTDISCQGFFVAVKVGQFPHK